MERKLMDPELKAQWLAELRSGKYRQAHCKLYRTKGGADNYCCLGILALVMNLTLDEAKEEYADTISTVYGSEKSPLDQETAYELWMMNDKFKTDDPENFLGIANWIEANL